MLSSLIVILASLAILPAAYVVSRAVVRAILNAFMDDRVQLTFRAADGQTYRRTLKISRDQEIDKLLADIVSQSKKRGEKR